jgi:hypothetical protein
MCKTAHQGDLNIIDGTRWLGSDMIYDQSYGVSAGN